MDRRAAARSSFAVMDRAVTRRGVNRPLLAILAATALAGIGMGGWAYDVWVVTPSLTVTADHLAVGTVQQRDFQAYVPVSFGELPPP